MARFANTASRERGKVRQTAKVRAAAPTSIGANPRLGLTANGARGYVGDNAHVELFNAAVNGLLADNSYIKRLRELVPQCDPAWLAQFIPWLRDEAHIRSAPLVIAAEYVHTFNGNGRTIVDSALKRADEPGEILAYWIDTYGRPIPSALKRGISDACQRLYNEYSLVRYDGVGKTWRFGDVIEMVHAKPKAGWQSKLYQYALDRRRHPEEVAPAELEHVTEVRFLDGLPPAVRRSKLKRAAKVFSWERMGGWLPGGLDSDAWEALLPNMGYFALLRNLNNFDRAKIGSETVKLVIERLTDAEEIERSKVLPFRFLTAYFSMETDRYRQALSDAADVALRNLPYFPGSTLIMTDCSGSMGEAVGAGKSRNPLTRSQLAGFWAEALARRTDKPRIVTYDTQLLRHSTPDHVSVIKAASHERYQPRGGTNTWACTQAAYNGEDRVFILTDEQSSDSVGRNAEAAVPIITWNLAGTAVHHAAHGAKNFHFVAGMTDNVLQTLPAVIARGTTGKWPWED
jgi:hypothetical protein